MKGVPCGGDPFGGEPRTESACGGEFGRDLEVSGGVILGEVPALGRIFDSMGGTTSEEADAEPCTGCGRGCAKETELRFPLEGLEGTVKETLGEEVELELEEEKSSGED